MTTEAAVTPDYSSTAKWLHWLMAFFLILDLTFGQGLSSIPVEQKAETLVGHSSLGTILLTLVVLRLAWRLFHPAPPLPGSVPDWQRLAARVSHITLYILMFSVPLSGFYIALSSPVPVEPFGVVSLGGIEMDEAVFLDVRQWHEIGTELLIAMIALHFSAALYHRFVLKDGVLQRMAPRFAKK